MAARADFIHFDRVIARNPGHALSARKGGQRVNRRSREVGFIFIAAIRRDSTPERRRIERGAKKRRGGKGKRRLTSLGQSVAVVTVNDATSNAVGIFSASVSRSLSSSFSFSPSCSLFSVPTYRARRIVIAASFRSSVVSRPRTRSGIHDRLGTLPGVSSLARVYLVYGSLGMLARFGDRDIFFFEKKVI